MHKNEIILSASVVFLICLIMKKEYYCSKEHYSRR